MYFWGRTIAVLFTWYFNDSAPRRFFLSSIHREIVFVTTSHSFNAHKELLLCRISLFFLPHPPASTCVIFFREQSITFVGETERAWKKNRYICIYLGNAKNWKGRRKCVDLMLISKLMYVYVYIHVYTYMYIYSTLTKSNI